MSSTNRVVRSCSRLREKSTPENYTGLLTNSTINGMIMQATDGAGIVLEHRFFGLSNPYPDLPVKGAFWKDGFYSTECGNSTAEACFGTHDSTSSSWNNTGLSDDRSWNWMVCNQFGFSRIGASEGHPTIVSRHLTAQYYERGCQYDFPGAFKGPKKLSILNALAVNNAYGGWNVTTDRLIFANGQRHPWREATVAANGASFPKMALQPHLLSDGFHCSDMDASEGVSKAIKAVQDATVEYMTKWYADWKKSA
ncbi:hypothetical protein K466DRAFT_532012 [Polyporus arcularius HHB13444]|uniref:Peptidase S28 n=1 Tax=Polyporus arcularius HHB13444 TaxID=1314778 RepID=A0A5C3P616_9APHY|nr:hypothetical protein K466DRAFT_532012 [Polyporus arcularius HHB13444]